MNPLSLSFYLGVVAGVLLGPLVWLACVRVVRRVRPRRPSLSGPQAYSPAVRAALVFEQALDAAWVEFQRRLVRPPDGDRR